MSLFILFFYTEKIKESLRIYFSLTLIFLSLFFDVDFFVIFFGMFIADLYVNKNDFLMKNLDRLFYFFILFGVFIGCMNVANIKPDSFMYYLYLPITHTLTLLNQNPFHYPRALSAIFIFLALLSSNKMQKVFSHPIFLFLGKYSYALFLTHTVFLLTITSFMINNLSRFNLFSYSGNVLFSFFATLPLLILFTYFINHIDQFAIKLSRKI